MAYIFSVYTTTPDSDLYYMETDENGPIPYNPRENASAVNETDSTVEEMEYLLPYLKILQDDTVNDHFTSDVSTRMPNRDIPTASNDIEMDYCCSLLDRNLYLKYLNIISKRNKHHDTDGNQNSKYGSTTQETSRNIVSIDEIANSIERLSDNLWDEAHRIFKETEKSTDRCYKKMFSNIKMISANYINNYEHKVQGNTISYDELTESVLSHFFDVVNYEDKHFLEFSEEKFLNILSMNDPKLFEALSVKPFEALSVKERSDYKCLIVFEFFNLRKYYHILPELLVLEQVIFVSLIYQMKILCYLRALNVYLNYLLRAGDVHTEMKRKIYQLIEKIFTSGTQASFCKIEEVQSKFSEPFQCTMKHNNYLCIFLYNMENKTRKMLLKDQCIKERFLKASRYIKIVGLKLLYSRLLLGNYLYFQKYDEQKIEEFIAFCNTQNECTNCIMTKCGDILCL